MYPHLRADYCRHRHLLVSQDLQVRIKYFLELHNADHTFISKLRLSESLHIYIYFWCIDSKLKLYFWPPVPNLDKVLQRYLTEMNGQRWVNHFEWIGLLSHNGEITNNTKKTTWDLVTNVLFLFTPQNPPLAAKPCKIAPSFLEVMSEDEAVVSEKRAKTSIQLLPHPEPPDEPPGVEGYPGYVTLRKGAFIHCPKANMYIHNRSTHERERQPLTDQPVHTCTDGPGCDLHCSGNEFLNQSYVPQAEPADGFKCLMTVVRESGNVYTNLPCS